MVPLSHPCMTTGKTKALTIQTFLRKGMSLFFNMYILISSFVIVFQGANVLISWLKSLSMVILETKKMKFVILSTFSHLFAMK